MKKIKEFLKSEKFKILLTSILMIFALIFAIFMAFQEETTKINNNHELVELEKQERQPIKHYNINTDTQDIYFSRQVVPVCIFEDDIDFYILSYGFEFSLGYVIENNNIFVDSLSVRAFVYKSTIIETSDYTGIDLVDDFSAPIYYGTANLNTKIAINQLSNFETSCNITKPYNDIYLYYDFEFDLYNLDGENVVNILQEHCKGFRNSSFSFDYGVAQLRRLNNYNNYSQIVDLNYFDVTEFYTSGYSTGFINGQNKQKELYEQSDSAISKIWDILENGIETALNVLSIEILPGIPLTICIIVPLIFGIIFFIWKGGAQ